ncbi:unnamed protein product [Umbelopsis sp. WA50703]
MSVITNLRELKKDSGINKLQPKRGQANEEKKDENEITKEMLNWKHKFHAVENEKQKLVAQTEEKMKKREEAFQLELATEIAAHSAKIEEFSDEIRRLVTENEAIRGQLAAKNMEPTTALLDSELNENNDYANADRRFIKDAHRSAISSVNDTTDMVESLKTNIENTVQAIDFELGLLKVGHLVPREELAALARGQERSASQIAKDTFKRALPGLFVRSKSDRRRSKGGSSRVDNSDAASIKSCDTASSTKTADTRWSALDNRQPGGEYLYSEEIYKLPKSATVTSGLRTLLSSNQLAFDDNEETEAEVGLHDFHDEPREELWNQTQTPYILRHPKDSDNITPLGGVEMANAKQNSIAWTKRKRVVPINALPPIMSTSQSHPTHLHR